MGNLKSTFLEFSATNFKYTQTPECGNTGKEPYVCTETTLAQMDNEENLYERWQFFECCECPDGDDAKCKPRPNGLSKVDLGCQSGDQAQVAKRGAVNSFHDTDTDCDDVSWDPVASLLHDVRNFDFRPRDDTVVVKDGENKEQTMG